MFMCIRHIVHVLWNWINTKTKESYACTKNKNNEWNRITDEMVIQYQTWELSSTDKYIKFIRRYWKVPDLKHFSKLVFRCLIIEKVVSRSRSGWEPLSIPSYIKLMCSLCVLSKDIKHTNFIHNIISASCPSNKLETK